MLRGFVSAHVDCAGTTKSQVYFRPGAIRRSAGEDGDPDKADPLNLASFDGERTVLAQSGTD